MTTQDPNRDGISLSEAVYAVIDAAGHDQGEKIKEFIIQSRKYSPIYEYSPYRVKRERQSEELRALAVQAENNANEIIYNLLKSGRIGGDGMLPSGERREITKDEWKVCHINIRRNQLLPSFEEPHFSQILGVRVDKERLLSELAGLVGLMGAKDNAKTHQASSRRMPPDRASEAALRRAFVDRVENWPTEKPHPSEIADIKAMEAAVGKFSRPLFRKIRGEEAPTHWLQPGRPQKPAEK